MQLKSLPCLNVVLPARPCNLNSKIKSSGQSQTRGKHGKPEPCPGHQRGFGAACAMEEAREQEDSERLTDGSIEKLGGG